MISLTNEERKLHCKQKFIIYAKNNFVPLIKNIKRLEIIVITLENIEELLITFAI